MNFSAQKTTENMRRLKRKTLMDDHCLSLNRFIEFEIIHMPTPRCILSFCQHGVDQWGAYKMRKYIDYCTKLKVIIDLRADEKKKRKKLQIFRFTIPGLPIMRQIVFTYISKLCQNNC